MFKVDLVLCLLHLAPAIHAVVRMLRSASRMELIFQGGLLLLNLVIALIGWRANLGLLSGRHRFARWAYANAGLCVVGRIWAMAAAARLTLEAQWPSRSLGEFLGDAEPMPDMIYLIAIVVAYNLLYAASVFQFIKWSAVVTRTPGHLAPPGSAHAA